MKGKWEDLPGTGNIANLPEGFLREKDVDLYTKLDRINNLAIELSSIPLDGDIYKPITQNVKKLTKAMFVTISIFERETSTMNLAGISSSGKRMKLAESMLGSNLVGMKMIVQDDIKERILNSSVGYTKDLHEVSFNTIPRPVAATVQTLLGLKMFIAIPLRYQGELLGILMVALGKDSPNINLKLIQVVGNLLSMILRRRKIEGSLMNAEVKYLDLFKNSRDAIFMSTPGGKTIDFNPALEELLGYDSSELRGMDVKNTYSDPAAREVFKERLETEGFVKDHYVVLMKKNGSLVECQITATMKRKEDGSNVIQGIIRDISTQREIQAELIRERNKAELYFDLLGHDIGNIHQGLLGTLFYARRSREDPERLDSMLVSAEELLGRSVTLVSNVRLMAKMRKSDMNPGWIDVVPLLNDTMEDMKKIFRGREIRTELVSDMERAEVFAEPMVREIFFNLLHNSVKVQSGEEVYLGVSIRAREDTDRIEIIMDDKGPGIPDEQKKVILSMEDHEMKKLRTGLGLSIVKALVERYNGTIEIRDRVEGDHSQGARFVLTFRSR